MTTARRLWPHLQHDGGRDAGVVGQPGGLCRQQQRQDGRLVPPRLLAHAVHICGLHLLSPAAAASDVQQANAEEVIWQLPSQLEPQIAFGCSVEQALGSDAEVSPVTYKAGLAIALQTSGEMQHLCCLECGWQPLAA